MCTLFCKRAFKNFSHILCFRKTFRSEKISSFPTAHKLNFEKNVSIVTISWGTVNTFITIWILENIFLKKENRNTRESFYCLCPFNSHFIYHLCVCLLQFHIDCLVPFLVYGFLFLRWISNINHQWYYQISLVFTVLVTHCMLDFPKNCLVGSTRTSASMVALITCHLGVGWNQFLLNNNFCYPLNMYPLHLFLFFKLEAEGWRCAMYSPALSIKSLIVFFATCITLGHPRKFHFSQHGPMSNLS